MLVQEIQYPFRVFFLDQLVAPGLKVSPDQGVPAKAHVSIGSPLQNSAKRRSSDDLGSYEPPRSYERRRVRKTRRAPSTRVAPRAADDDDVLGSSLDSL